MRRYRQAFGRWPNVVAPRRFSEKMLYKKLYDQRPIMAVWTDKLAVRDHVRDRLGTDRHLIPLLGVYQTADEVAAAAGHLPGSFVLKASHGSGWVKVFRPGTPRAADDLRALAAEWLGGDYATISNEWAYRGLSRRVMAEQFLENGGRIASDYKFLCFNGVPRLVMATQDRFSAFKASTFDLDWREVSLRQWHHPPVIDLPRPSTFDEMADIARRLSAETDFVRVDLYEAGGRVYFGELTSYHFGGLVGFEPPHWDRDLGRWWRVPRRYR
jgi:hypothetical protein